MKPRGGCVRVEQGDLPADLAPAFGEVDRIAWDVETTGLDWRQERLATCQLFAEGVGVVMVRTADGYPRRLAALLEDPAVEKVFHHAPFDLRFMVHAWGIQPASIRCTKVASKLLTPDAPNETHSLQQLVARNLAHHHYSPGRGERQPVEAQGEDLAGHAEMGVESVEPGTVNFSWQLWRSRARRAVRRGVPGLQPGRDQRVSRQSRRCQPAALPDPAVDHDRCADGTVCDRAARVRGRRRRTGVRGGLQSGFPEASGVVPQPAGQPVGDGGTR